MHVHLIFIVEWFVSIDLLVIKIISVLQLKTLLESYSEAQEDFTEALNISPINLRARYQKLINDAKIGNKEHKPERVEQALASFEEYYDTCKQDIYYALALISVN